MNERKEKTSLFDRIAITFLCGVLAFITGTIIWFVAAYTLSFITSTLTLSFAPVIIFSVFMACLGFLTQTNLLANIFGVIWQAIYRAAKYW